MRVSGGTRAGRSHRRRDTPCQDSFAVWRQPDGARAAAAVADGLGSRPLSHLGSQAATRAAVDHLAGEPAWNEEALVRAFAAARAAVQAAADERGLPIEDLATTLQVATLEGGIAQAGMVGDGAIVSAGTPDGDAAPRDEPLAHGQTVTTGVDVLLAAAEGGYANEVFPLTDADWRTHLRLAHHEDARTVLLFTDGLTRLLLAKSRQGWQPFAPFFQAFLPRLTATSFDESLVAGFLAGDSVDSSWDDDKGLVVLSHGPGPIQSNPVPAILAEAKDAGEDAAVGASTETGRDAPPDHRGTPEADHA